MKKEKNKIEKKQKLEGQRHLTRRQTAIQSVKFVLFSAGAGIIQFFSFTILELGFKLPYWGCYLPALCLSVLFNFTINRKYTFKSANNVPVAMVKVFCFYLVFTPLSTWWGNALDQQAGWNEYLILAFTMIVNFVTEFLYDRFFVFGKSINTNELGIREREKMEREKTGPAGITRAARLTEHCVLFSSWRGQMSRERRENAMPVWNPWHGCHKISPGCRNCYVYRRDSQFGKDSTMVSRTRSFDLPMQKGRDGAFRIPGGSTVYTCMTSDFFLEEADLWRAEAWAMIRARTDLRFILITKRIRRFQIMLPEDWGDGYENVTVLCTCEDQKRAEERLPFFLELPIRHREIIAEPMLEALDLEPYLATGKIESVSCGGESGENARTCDYDWVLELRKQCISAGVRFQFRQTGANFHKDGRDYPIKRRFQQSQARRAGIDYLCGDSLNTLFERLARSPFRSRFRLTEKERQSIREKGMDTIRTHAEAFVARRLAPAVIENDGRQTPMRGHPVFIAQHATGTCCRGCLNKWHGIPKDRALTVPEQQYAVSVIMEWIRRQYL